MRKILSALALFALTLPIFAEPKEWSNQGTHWSSVTGVKVNVPKSFKTEVSDDGNLSIEDDHVLIVLLPVPDGTGVDEFMTEMQAEITKQFPGLKLSALRQASDKGITVKLKDGTIKQGGKTLEVTIAEFIKGKHICGAMTIQQSGDKTASQETDSIMSTIDLP